MWSRRQFGRWAGAALLLGPSAAQAAPPEAQAKQSSPLVDTPPEVPGPSALDAIDLSLTLVSVTERAKDGLTPDVELQLHAVNRAERGQSVSVSLGAAALLLDGESHPVHAWLNDEHPFSRRIAMPSFVDLAPGKQPSLVAAVKVVSEDGATKPGMVLKLTARLFDAHGNSREVELPPVPLAGEKAES